MMKAPRGVTVTTPRANNVNQHKIQFNFSLGPEYMDICESNSPGNEMRIEKDDTKRG